MTTTDDLRLYFGSEEDAEAAARDLYPLFSLESIHSAAVPKMGKTWVLIVKVPAGMTLQTLFVNETLMAQVDMVVRAHQGVVSGVDTP